MSTLTHRLWFLTLLSFALLFPACPPPGAKLGLDRHAMEDDLDRESLRRAVSQSLAFLDRVPADRIVGQWPRRLTAGEVKDSLVAFLELLDRAGDRKSLDDGVRTRFDLFELPDSSNREEVLFTGYYQPVIKGSLVETKEYRYPIYGIPRDLIEVRLNDFKDHFPSDLAGKVAREKIVGRVDGNLLVPYFSRHEIETLVQIGGKGYEIAWAQDPVDLFFLHIQGSGLLQLEDGRLLQLNYAASNGRPYSSIGKLLLEQGKIPDKNVSMQGLRRYLGEHPEERETILSLNERYIFFRFLEDGPVGNLGVTLTPGRSMATDARLFPKGALAFIVTRQPVLDNEGNLSGWQPLSRFVLNQDTGNAIQGMDRVDLYFGTGPDAGAVAGRMKSKGKLYF
ncbi:MAG TPA: MltA domain-containing protein, partial [Candidatus Binatia bacterium]